MPSGRHRPEPYWLYRARTAHDDFSRLRAIDLIALVLGYGFLLAVFVGGVTTLIDAVQGNPHTVWPQIAALLAWIDGGVR